MDPNMIYYSSSPLPQPGLLSDTWQCFTCPRSRGAGAEGRRPRSRCAGLAPLRAAAGALLPAPGDMQGCLRLGTENRAALNQAAASTL